MPGQSGSLWCHPYSDRWEISPGISAHVSTVHLFHREWPGNGTLEKIGAKKKKKPEKPRACGIDHGRGCCHQSSHGDIEDCMLMMYGVDVLLVSHAIGIQGHTCT